MHNQLREFKEKGARELANAVHTHLCDRMSWNPHVYMQATEGSLITDT